jgi:predicted glutamine amidotransferase
MCRLAFIDGDYISKEIIIKFLRQSIEIKNTPNHDSYLDADYHLDGYGIAWYLEKWYVYKSKDVFNKDDKLDSMLDTIILLKPKKIIAHIRNKGDLSIGDAELNNCHPFLYRNYVFCHNGYIAHFMENKEKILSLIKPEFIKEIKGETDSEHLFYLILSLQIFSENEIKQIFKINNIRVIGNCIFGINDKINIYRFYNMYDHIYIIMMIIK